MRTHAENGTLVAPGTDGRRTAVCSLGGVLRIRDTATGRTVPGSWEKAGAVCDNERSVLAFDSGRRLAAVNGDGVRVWDVRSGDPVAELGDPGARFASFSPDDDFLATADDEELRVWRIGVDRPVFRQPLNNEQVYGTLAWDPDGTVLRYTEGGSVHSLDISRTVTRDWRPDPVDAAVLAPDGHTLATARRTGDTYRVEVRDTRAGRAARTLPAPPLPVAHGSSPGVSPEQTTPLLSFSPDGKALAYGVSAPGTQSSPQRLTVWDVAKGRTRTTLDLSGGEARNAVLSIALGPGGRTLHVDRATAAGPLAEEDWDVSRRRGRAGPTALDSADLAVRPDGRLLVADSHVTGLPSGPTTRRDLVRGNEIGAVAFAADGSLLAAGDRAGRVTLWDGGIRLRKGVLWNVFPAPARGTVEADTAGGAEAVSALAVSPDDRTLAVGGDAGSVQLWDLATQQPLGGALTTPGERIDSLAFGPDSGTLYASSAHVPLQRYTVAPARAAEAVCARAGGTGLTRQQWHAYVTGVPYRRVCPGS
ncbi:WD40 repeat domain-containing protein [Streptomyces sp. NPDC091280]|uniref:WD40 repeat domain-containing protein n=1 Tax=Streptomyces sp. NPDC091280 TaxID=3365984 RepID=UPI003813CB57